MSHNDLAVREEPTMEESVQTAMVTSREAQEVQAAIIVAQRFPRNTVKAFEQIIEACSRIKLAEKAVYSYPRGGTTVTGPSIRLAETIAKAWGHIDAGTIELERKPAVGAVPGESVMRSYCWDLQSNTRFQKTFTVRHMRDKKGGGVALSDERDVYEATANAAARRLRSCILNVIPADIIESAVEKCVQTLEKNIGPVIDKIRKMVVEFKVQGVTQEMIEERLGHKIEVTTAAEIVQLHTIFNSIRDGMADRSQFFNIGPATKVVVPEQPAPQKLKNFAPQSPAEAQAMNVAPTVAPITSKVPPQATGPKRPRGEIAKDVVNMFKALGIKGEAAIGQKVKSVMKKSAAELSDAEMEGFLTVLKLEVSNAAKSNG